MARSRFPKATALLMAGTKRGLFLFVVLRDPAGRGPNVSLQQVPEKRSGKRSRLHLDLYTNNREGEVERLVKIGATRYPWRYKPGHDFIVLEDPDGNLFCVVQVTGETWRDVTLRHRREQEQSDPLPGRLNS